MLLRSKALEVHHWVIAPDHLDDWPDVLANAKRTSGIGVLGIHPWFASIIHTERYPTLLQQLEDSEIRGIGEIGLDNLHIQGSAHHFKNQRRVLTDQLSIARTRNIPVIFHCVRAYPELLQILKHEKLPPAGAVVHGWNGPNAFLDGFLSLGMQLSIGPQILNASAGPLRRQLLQIPIENLLLETGSPGHGKEPADLREIGIAVAKAKNLDFEEVWGHCAQNAHRIWAISGSP